MQWLGYYLGILHVSIIISFLVLIIVSHTLLHDRWLKTGIFLFLVLMFVQHLVFGGCIITVYEKKLSQQEMAPFHMITEQIMKSIGLTMEHYWKYTEVIEGTMALFLALELASLYLA
jgi:hypothetical protein